MSKATGAVIQYDIDVVNFAMSLGWKDTSMLGDLPSHEAVIEKIKTNNSVDHETAVQTYRQLIAEEIDEFLTEKLGERSEEVL